MKDCLKDIRGAAAALLLSWLSSWLSAWKAKAIAAATGLVLSDSQVLTTQLALLIFGLVCLIVSLFVLWRKSVARAVRAEQRVVDVIKKQRQPRSTGWVQGWRWKD
jgi:hypothetical protein